MAFNSSFINCSFSMVITLLYSIYKIRVIPIFDLVLSASFLIIAIYYLIEMLVASNSSQYSINLNHLTSLVFQDYSKFENQMRKDSEFRKKVEFDFKMYGSIMEQLDKENSFNNPDELNESSIGLNK